MPPKRRGVKYKKALDAMLWNLFCSDKQPKNFEVRAVFKKTSLTVMSRRHITNKLIK